MNNTARTHARTERNDLPVGVLCPCRLASSQPPIMAAFIVTTTVINLPLLILLLLLPFQLVVVTVVFEIMVVENSC